MADFQSRLKQNVPGRFYVDDTCVDCDACRDVAPKLFKRDDENGVAYVSRQPVTPEEVQLAIEAMESCCVESIGDDGDRNDWSVAPGGVFVSDDQAGTR